MRLNLQNKQLIERAMEIKGNRMKKVNKQIVSVMSFIPNASNRVPALSDRTSATTSFSLVYLIKLNKF